MILVTSLYFVSAIIFLLCKVSVSVAKPLFFVGIRMLIAGIIMLMVEEWRHGGISKLFGVHKQHLKDLLYLSIFHSYLPFVPKFLAIPYVSSIKLNLLWSLAPFVAALLSYLFYNERLRWVQIGGVAIAFGAMIPNICAGSAEGVASPLFLLPELGIIISMASSAYAWFIFKKLMQNNLTTFVANGFSMLIAGPTILVTSFFYEGWHDSLFYSWFDFFTVLIALLLLSNFFYYSLYAYLLKYYSITFITVCGFMTPLFGGVLGWYFLQESITWTFYVAAAGVAVGLYLFTFDGGPKEVDTEALS
jgi:drug/metabolite transporter (DMT)-like permease